MSVYKLLIKNNKNSNYDEILETLVSEDQKKLSVLGGCLIGGNKLLLKLAQNAREAILNGITPTIIEKGYSGTYRLFNLNKRTIAIFKPRDEHPYSGSNPKWLPYLVQKISPFNICRGCHVPE